MIVPWENHKQIFLGLPAIISPEFWANVLHICIGILADLISYLCLRFKDQTQNKRSVVLNNLKPCSTKEPQNLLLIRVCTIQLLPIMDTSVQVSIVLIIRGLLHCHSMASLTHFITLFA